MSIKFFLSNNQVFVNNQNPDFVVDKLEPKVYKVSYSEQTGFFLTILQNKFTVPNKLYGSTTNRIHKILTTYESRDSQMGVLLTGSKGTGKTILTEALCNQAIEQGLPVIIISSAFSGSDFFTFMSHLGECVVLFDEFGKVYKDSREEKQQESLLSFLDGTYSTKRLLLFTENQEFSINEFLLNRPGRVFYHFKYDRVEDEVILEYCKDFNIDEKEVTELLSIADNVTGFSFDMLKAIIDEHIRYNQPMTTVIEDMNISLSSLNSTFHIQSIIENGEELLTKTKQITTFNRGCIDFPLYKTQEDLNNGDMYKFFDADTKNPHLKRGDTYYLEDSGVIVIGTLETSRIDYRAF